MKACIFQIQKISSSNIGKTSIIILFLLISLYTSGQTNTFQKVYGGSAYNEGRALCRASDGGYILLGSSSDANSQPPFIYVLKTDTNGNEIWNKHFGLGFINVGSSIHLTKDSGFIICGYTENDTNKYDILLIKIDSIGNLQWMKTYGGTDWDFGSSVVEIPGQGYLICGETYSYGNGNNDLYLIKCDLNGDTVWTKTYGSSGMETGNSVQNTTDGGFIVAGKTSVQGRGDNDLWLLKLNANGDTSWTKSFGGIYDDVGNSVKQSLDNGFIIAGYTQNNSKMKDCYVVKTDVNGNVIWQNNFGNVLDDWGNDVIQTADGEFLIGGAFSSTFPYGGGGKDFYILKLKTDGSLRWSSTLGMGNDEEAFVLTQVYQNCFLMLGTTSSVGNGLNNILFMKLETPGDTLVYVAPFVQSIEEEIYFQKSNFYPNPFHEKTLLKLPENFSNPEVSVFDIAGRKSNLSTQINGNEILITNRDFPIGMYFVTIRNKEGKFLYRKIIIN